MGRSFFNSWTKREAQLARKCHANTTVILWYPFSAEKEPGVASLLGFPLLPLSPKKHRVSLYRGVETEAPASWVGGDGWAEGRSAGTVWFSQDKARSHAKSILSMDESGWNPLALDPKNPVARAAQQNRPREEHPAATPIGWGHPLRWIICRTLKEPTENPHCEWKSRPTTINVRRHCQISLCMFVRRKCIAGQPWGNPLCYLGCEIVEWFGGFDDGAVIVAVVVVVVAAAGNNGSQYLTFLMKHGL